MLRTIVTLVALGAFVWFGWTVQLGAKTFFGHARAIAGSKEARDLAQGSRQAVQPYIDKLKLDKSSSAKGPPKAKREKHPSS